MVPSAATASAGMLAASGVGSEVTVETTVAVAAWMATTVSLRVAAYNVAPSALSARLFTGAPTVT